MVKFAGYEPLGVKIPNPNMMSFDYFNSVNKYNNYLQNEAKTQELQRAEEERQALNDYINSITSSGQEVTTDSITPGMKKTFMEHGDVDNLLKLLSQEEQQRRAQEAQDKQDLSMTLQIARGDPQMAYDYFKQNGLDKKYGDRDFGQFRKLDSVGVRDKGYWTEDGFVTVVPGTGTSGGRESKMWRIPGTSNVIPEPPPEKKDFYIAQGFVPEKDAEKAALDKAEMDKWKKGKEQQTTPRAEEESILKSFLNMFSNKTVSPERDDRVIRVKKKKG